MSALSVSAPTDFDFWEFVCCARCQLSFASDAGASVPFWLTECGHVVCNAHLNADQSCAQCGTAGIQLVPLQPQMDAPMADWFRNIPMSLDAVAYAAKFQQETMGAQIRYYKTRQQQQQSLNERLKRENAELKKTVQTLTDENAQFRQHFGYQGGGGAEPSEFHNSNGKRPMNNGDQYRTGTSSSRSAVTPLGPNRLTLPPGQQPPSLSSNRPEDPPTRPPPKAVANNQRPGSSRFIEKYSYAPPTAAQFRPQQLSYSQAAPRRAKQSHQEQQQQQPQAQARSMPMTSTAVARFKPAQTQGVALPNSQPRPSQTSVQTQPQNRPRNMGPPPTPQQARMPPPSSARRNGNPSFPVPANANNNQFLPPSQRSAPSGGIADQQRFIPATASGGVPQRFTADGGGSAGNSSTRTSRAMPNMNMAGGGQRVPFVPHDSGGFG